MEAVLKQGHRGKLCPGVSQDVLGGCSGNQIVGDGSKIVLCRVLQRRTTIKIIRAWRMRQCLFRSAMTCTRSYFGLCDLSVACEVSRLHATASIGRNRWKPRWSQVMMLLIYDKSCQCRLRVVPRIRATPTYLRCGALLFSFFVSHYFPFEICFSTLQIKKNSGVYQPVDSRRNQTNACFETFRREPSMFSRRRLCLSYREEHLHVLGATATAINGPVCSQEPESLRQAPAVDFDATQPRIIIRTGPPA